MAEAARSAPYYQNDHITLHHGNAMRLATTLDPQSVQTIVTSPPYFGLRNYDSSEQFGTERSVDDFVQNLVDLFALLRPALADDGTLWLNLGDSYNAYNGNRGESKTGFSKNGPLPSLPSGYGLTVRGLAAKNLIGVPWRVALALQADGWILRSDIIWAKPNPMPESVTDRPTKSHEYIFLFAKQPKYFYDKASIEETSVNADRREKKNKRTVWTTPTQPFAGAHFAVYPPELIRPCILAGSRSGDTVLDPFSGSGTTGMVAVQEGRKYVGFELNSDYLDLSIKTRFAQYP